MTPGNDRLDRTEGIREEVSKELVAVDAMLKKMAARQKHHEEAFERFDARMRVIQEKTAINGEIIRALERIAKGPTA